MTIHSFLSAITSTSVLWMLAILGLCLWMAFRPFGKEAPKIILLILVVAFQPFTVAVMVAESRLVPLRFDYFLYLVDKSLGVSAFLVARLFTEWQRSLLWTIYQSLPAAMVAWYGANLVRKDGKPKKLLIGYLVVLVVGPCLYLIVPACGPRHAFGSAFPLGDPNVAPVLARVDGWPNAIPSVHLATALLFVFFAGENRWLRGLAWIYAAGTVAATLAFEHYMIDLIVAVPFACFAALATRGRVRPALANLAVVVAWLLAIRFGTPVLIAHPLFLRALALATLVGAGFSMTAEREPKERPNVKCVALEAFN